MELIEFDFSFVKAKALKTGMWVSPSFDSPAFCVTQVITKNDETLLQGSNGNSYSYSADDIVKLSAKKLTLSIPAELHEYALLTEYLNSQGGVSLYTIDDGLGTVTYMTPYNADGLTSMSSFLLEQYNKNNSQHNLFGIAITEKEFDTDTLEILEEQTHFNGVEKSYSSRVDLTGLSKKKQEEDHLNREDNLLSLDFDVSYTTRVGKLISRNQNIQFVKSEELGSWSCFACIEDIPTYRLIENSAEHMGQTLISMGRALIDNKDEIGNLNLNNLKCK